MSVSGGLKLRSACDACAVSKIKCDKKQPVCTRCSTNNFTCSFSPSRRHGKQSWAKRVAEQQQQAIQEPQRRPTYPLDALPSSNDDLGSVGMTQLDQGPQLDFGGGNGNGINNVDFLSNWTWMGPDSAIDLSTFNEPSVTAATPKTPIPSESTPPVTLHDCEAKAMITLHSLHYCTMYHSDRPECLKPVPGGFPVANGERPPAPGSLLPLDKILSFNRMAMGTLMELLDCPCAHQPHLALLYMAILSKSLSWYRIAVAPQQQIICPSAELSANSSDNSIVPTPASSSTSVLGERGVESTSIRIGAFDLEEEDQKALMRNVLTRVVRKMEGTLDKMQASAESNHNVWGEEGEDYQETCTSWYNLGLPKMKAEVKDTLRQIREFGGTVQ
ncbi:hypothetical protein K458DRAFT_414139 [Lentithecium fluviatile CBS 122367]|uniref:Zn(2)-C6 fungal-type domain-containing protein n=1 Tax=Lentithecium fluviatile CBS 122367 TaxID=1168545 RepID=A0A6G1JCV4_9PLEO|nr:hypothetical protein K458DRAFT_414139 [Lentithecium fluviatile CBS 122367]